MRVHFDGCNWEQCRCELKCYRTVLGVNFAIFVLELIGGFISGSLSLLSDAGHVLTHNITIGLAIAVAYLIYKDSSREKRIRKIGSFITALVFITLAAWIGFEAVHRMSGTVEISSLTMLSFAVVGCLGNYLQLRMLDHEGEKNITNKDLIFDAHSDLWQSLAVIVGAVIIFLTGTAIVDAILSIIIALAMFGRSAWQIYKLILA